MKEDFVDVKCSLYRTLTAEEELGIQIRGEIEYSGYALMALRPESSPRAVGFTLGLSFMGHPEILSVADREQDVFALLRYLADRVVTDKQVFTEGIQRTPIFEELVFTEPVRDIPILKMLPDVFDGIKPTWLTCREPSDIKRAVTAA